MSSSELDLVCCITVFKSGNGNTINHNDYEVIETSKTQLRISF